MDRVHGKDGAEEAPAGASHHSSCYCSFSSSSPPSSDDRPGVRAIPCSSHHDEREIAEADCAGAGAGVHLSGCSSSPENALAHGYISWKLDLPPPILVASCPSDHVVKELGRTRSEQAHLPSLRFSGEQPIQGARIQVAPRDTASCAISSGEDHPSFIMTVISESAEFQFGHPRREVKAKQGTPQLKLGFNDCDENLAAPNLLHLLMDNILWDVLEFSISWVTLRRYQPKLPSEWSWWMAMGSPFIQIDGICSIAASVMCVEAQHRLAFETLHGIGSFSLKAKRPKGVKKKCINKKVWSPADGAFVEDVLKVVAKGRGVETIQGIFLPINGYHMYKNVQKDVSHEAAVRLLLAHGPLLATLWVNDEYMICTTKNDLVYRGSSNSEKDPESYGGLLRLSVCWRGITPQGPRRPYRRWASEMGIVQVHR
uniref:Uncharacterized protein n=1 Tax=Oryza barthii TaxID=65489 RepID=A0A0D3FR82_9ORYZ